jgi:hypothetical protein
MITLSMLYQHDVMMIFCSFIIMVVDDVDGR